MPKDKSDLQEVWTVDVYTNDINIDTGTVMVVSTKEEARRRVKALNEKESYGVPLVDGFVDTDSKEYEETMLRCGNYLFYDIGGFYIDEPFFLDQEEN